MRPGTGEVRRGGEGCSRSGNDCGYVINVEDSVGYTATTSSGACLDRASVPLSPARPLVQQSRAGCGTSMPRQSRVRVDGAAQFESIGCEVWRKLDDIERAWRRRGSWVLTHQLSDRGS